MLDANFRASTAAIYVYILKGSCAARFNSEINFCNRMFPHTPLSPRKVSLIVIKVTPHSTPYRFRRLVIFNPAVKVI